MNNTLMTIPTRGRVAPQVLYSVQTVALHLIAVPEDGRGRETPSVKTRLVEITREGAEGVANAQAIRMMALGGELFDAVKDLLAIRDRNYALVGADEEAARVVNARVLLHKVIG